MAPSQGTGSNLLSLTFAWRRVGKIALDVIEFRFAHKQFASFMYVRRSCTICPIAWEVAVTETLEAAGADGLTHSSGNVRHLTRTEIPGGGQIVIQGSLAYVG